MEVVLRQSNLSWLPQPNQVNLVIDDQAPPVELTTTAFVMAFSGDKLVMADIKTDERGYNPPGGHVEPGEDPETAVRREAMEEAGVTLVELRPFGYHHLQVLAAKPECYSYPYPESYQVFYLAEVGDVREVEENDEIRGRRFFLPDQARQTRWVKEHLPFYEAALKRKLGPEGSLG